MTEQESNSTTGIVTDWVNTVLTIVAVAFFWVTIFYCAEYCYLEVSRLERAAHLPPCGNLAIDHGYIVCSSDVRK